ncbi:hypothetical protein [Devosia sp. 1566]|uniref:hypothetical protein n=1 Tax=Devosia sp. 1566 TaxID=2499144 RepID=UPI000FDBC05D|nr:hypothetical protein [Devosia sp. 1566]
MYFETCESFRDVLLQISVHDDDRQLRHAADRCRRTMTHADLAEVVALADASRYRPSLMSAYAAVIVMEAA